MAKITKKSTLEKVLKLKGAEKVLEKFEIPCLHCPMARFEIGNLTLEIICANYGINLKKLIKELEKLE
ncbi:MAG: hypothetical protein U9Q06_04535 [Nanoarchaeota archaeon]|nr:hypothetical protein [Nanoarchaeota archaeon]